MYKLSKKIICLLLSACAIVTCVHAIEYRASNYFSKTEAQIDVRSGGKVDVWLDATARRNMTEIGASKIIIKESTDGGRSYSSVKTFESTKYPEMIGSGRKYTGVAVTYDGVPGRMYKATVYFYAADSSGSDTTTYTTSAETAIK